MCLGWFKAKLPAGTEGPCSEGHVNLLVPRGLACGGLHLLGRIRERRDTLPKFDPRRRMHLSRVFQTGLVRHTCLMLEIDGSALVRIVYGHGWRVCVGCRGGG